MRQACLHEQGSPPDFGPITPPSLDHEPSRSTIFTSGISLADGNVDPLDPKANGARTLTATLDRWRQVKPDKVFASMLRSANVADGFWDISMRDVANATDAFAHHLNTTLGLSTNFETIAYVGLNDLRYAVFLYAAIKCGYKALFVSPRNPPAQNASLLEQTKCRHFFHAVETYSVVQAVQSLLPAVEATPMQPLVFWIEAFVDVFPYNKTYEEAKWDPVVVLHSSGSTGTPKPVTMNQGYFAAAETPMRSLPDRELAGKPVFDFPEGGFFFCPFPFFHLAGLSAVCMYPSTATECSAVIALSDRPPTPLLIKQIIESKNVRALYSPPSLIEAITHLPGGTDTLTTLDVISYAGGPLSLACGNDLVKRVKLTTTYGSTETGANHMLITHPNDPNYFEFHPDFGIRMEPAVDGAYELVFRNDDPQAACRGIYWTYPDIKEFRTRDMFMAHPEKPNLWTFYARNDDIIVFDNGAKYNPVPAESALMNNVAVSGVLIVGDKRSQAAALIEPKEEPSSDEEFIDKIWPDVEIANAQSQKQGQLTRQNIAVLKPASTVRAPKGTIVRRMTAEKFKDDIENLYAARRTIIRGPTLAVHYSLHDAIINLVRDCTEKIGYIAGIGDEEDFYVRGLDSVQTVEMTRMLKSGLKPQYGDLPWLIGQTVFDFPSIKSLGTAIWRRLAPLAPEQDSHDAASSYDAMNDLIAKHSRKVIVREQSAVENDSVQPKRAHAVILTGSTGFLGLRLVLALLRSPEVEHIYCLDRGADAHARVMRELQHCDDVVQGLKKLTFYTAQFGSALLGLTQEIHRGLLQTVDLIIHNAWKVDFNHPLLSFEPVHINGLSNLIAFAAEAAYKPRLNFVSSISAVSNWPTVHGRGTTVPETIVSDSRVAAQMGYGQSKHVAERIIEAAAANSGSSASVACTVLRVGQIAGSIGQVDAGRHWNKAEWFPAMLQSSKELQCLPNWLPNVDWIPVDVLGCIIAGIALFEASATADPAAVAAASPLPAVQVHHLVNPRKTAWADLVPCVQARFGGSSVCPMVPYSAWLTKLRGLDAEDVTTLQKVPALKIRSFFDGLEIQYESGALTFDTLNAARSSGAMRTAEPVQPEWLDRWMKRWDI